MRPFASASRVMLALAMVGCATAQQGRVSREPFSGTDPGGALVSLTVQNNDFRDASVYIVWNGVRDRVGSVTGKTSQTFRTRWRSEQVQLEVDFVGGGGFRSDKMDVWQGDHLDFVILADM